MKKETISYILNWVSEHIISILIGGAIALLVISPHVRAWITLGPEYFEGVYPAFNDDEVYYQARIKEASEGNIAIGNPYLKEHMHDPFIMPPLAEWVLGAVTHFTNKSVPFVTSVSDFVFTYVGFILLYLLFLILTLRNKWVSLFYTVSFFCFYLSTFGRPISPQFNTIFLFVGLLYITKIYFREGLPSRTSNIIAGSVVGLSCFISPYYFTTLLGLYFLLIGLRAFLQKDYQFFKNTFPWFLISFSPFALLFVFFQWKASLVPFYSEALLRFGLMHTHIPGSFTNVALGALVLCLVLGARSVLTHSNFWYCFGLGLNIIALNWQNIFTGKSLQFSSHYAFTTILTILFILAILHTSLIRSSGNRLSKYKKYLIASGICFFFIIIIHLQREEFIRVFTVSLDRTVLLEDQGKMEVFDWFRQHTAPDTVVYTLGDDYDFLFPIYTENKVYYNFYVTLFTVSNHETEERWLIQHFFDSQVGTTTLRDAQRDFWGNRYIDRYQSNESRKKIVSLFTRVPYIPGLMIDDSQVAYMYERLVQIQSLSEEEVLSRYTIDYIFVSKKYQHFGEVLSRLEDIPVITHVTTLDAGEIYAVNPYTHQ